MELNRREIFIAKAMAKHGNTYSYSEVDYVDFRTPVTVRCAVHGLFPQNPRKHLSGQGCGKCGILRRAAIRSNEGGSDELSRLEWLRTVKRIIESLPEDEILNVVDVHS